VEFGSWVIVCCSSSCAKVLFGIVDDTFVDLTHADLLDTLMASYFSEYATVTSSYDKNGFGIGVGEHG
jgi:hypothetical protein